MEMKKRQNNREPPHEACSHNNNLYANVMNDQQYVFDFRSDAHVGATNAGNPVEDRTDIFIMDENVSLASSEDFGGSNSKISCDS